MKRITPYTGLTYKHQLLESNVTFRPEYHVAEIGVGTGYSCFKIAQKTASVVGIDVSEDLISALREFAKEHENVEFLQADVEEDSPPDSYLGKMDVVFSMDTLNYISPPRALFSFAEKMLKPGGRLFVTFPNEPDETMEGVSNFKSYEDLLESVSKGGLKTDSLVVAEYTAWFNFVSKNFWYRVKQMLFRSHLEHKVHPQVFEDTVAFKIVNRRRIVSLLAKAYKEFVMLLLSLGKVYRYTDSNEIYDKYIILKASKPEKDRTS